MKRKASNLEEKQDIEWKGSWRDEYLKWICGFANAEGGILFIGKDDRGNVIGVTNAPTLLENLPNKVRSVLGIVVEVNFHEEGSKSYLEILVEPYPYPVSYKGRYFVRSGSTNQELKGSALNKFLLERTGKKWDGVPVPSVSFSDLSGTALKRYREKAVKSNRIPKEVLDDSDEILLRNLRLLEKDLLKRAAILLFHPDPEKYIPGAYVKIGFFKTDDDLVFQDEVHGSLIDQVEKAFDLLRTKYSAYMIEYSGTGRVEKSLFPEEALREALLNALAHKDYSAHVPVQISVYPGQIVFWNAGELPDKLTVDSLRLKHPSIPYNPDVANGLFRSGDIESWGRGTIKMIKACIKHQLLPPAFDASGSGFQVNIIGDPKLYLESRGVNEVLITIVLETLAQGKITNKHVQEVCSVSKATATRYLDELEDRYLERVGATGRGTYYVIKGS